MDPIEPRVRASLRARADDVEPTPALYQGVQERIGRRRRRHVVSWAVAGVAVVAAAVVVVPDVLSDGGDPRPPEILDTPGPVETPAVVPAAGDPSHALLGREAGAIDLVDLADGAAEELWGGPGEVTAITVAPGATADDFRAAAVIDEGDAASVLTLTSADGTSTTDVTAAADLPGGTGQPPSIAIAPDGRSLAYTGLSLSVDAAPAVHVVPLSPEDGAPDVDATEEIHTVTTADPSGAIDALVEWVGATDQPGARSQLVVRGGGTIGALVLERTDDGFAVEQRESTGDLGGMSDVSSDFVRSPTHAAYVLDDTQDGADDAPRLSREGASVPLDRLGVPADEMQLDARGRTALVIGGGQAVTVRFPTAEDDGAGPVTGEVADDVTAGALLGGVGIDAGPEEPPDDEPVEEEGAFADGLVVADDRTVSLVRPDGNRRELVDFPTEGESSVVDVAVRPGSTEDDLVVAITTRAEGTFDIRWLRVVGGEVDTTIDPSGTDFPAPPISGAGGFPLAIADPQDGTEPAAAWSPDGDLLAVGYPTTDNPQVATIGWTEDGPNEDPNRAATFDLDTDQAVILRGWSWIDAPDDGADDVARDGQLLFVDELAGEAFTARLGRQADGAPAMPTSNPLEQVGEEGVLDLADGDGDGTFEVILTVDGGAPRLEVDGAAIDLPAEAAGPRQVGRVVVDGGTALVVLDPAQPVLVDLADGTSDGQVIGGEVVAADAVR